MEEHSKQKTPKSKERHLSNPQNENTLKRNNKAPGITKNDLSQLMPQQSFDVTSSVKKIFNEANKIVKIGVQQEFALKEKISTLQSSNETIDNLRKNILHLQMEYEKLDQNYQREISNRSEIAKRVDATKDIVESVVQYSNSLAASIKLLEDDKSRIIEYYEQIHQSQKEIEAKHAEAAKFIKELDNLIKSKIENLRNSYDKTLSQNSETISQLNRKLSYVTDKLKITEDENEKLQTKIEQYQETVKEMEASLQQQQNFNILEQDAISNLKFTVKKLKKQRFKYQKLLKIKKKKISSLVNSNNFWRKDLEKLEDIKQKFISENKVLESENDAWETKFENQLQEEALRNRNWEARVTELSDKIKLLEMENEDLKIENKNLNEKLSKLTKNEEGKDKEIEELQNDLSKMLSSNIKLQEDLKKLNDVTTRKENEISDLEAKMSELGSKLNSESVFYQNEAGRYQELVKKLESQLSDVEKKLSLEKNQKEILFSDYDGKLENLKAANEKIDKLEKLLEEKEAHIKAIEYQQTSQSLDGKKTVEKLNKDVHAQRVKNKELRTDLENLENNYLAVKNELQEAKNKISDFEEKLNEEKLLNKELKGTKNELEKNAAILKKEVENEKYSMQELQEKHRKAEKELIELKKTVEENVSLRSTVLDLRNILKATEARVEAYKLELSRQEETTKKMAESSKLLLGTSQGNAEHQLNEKDLESSSAKSQRKISKKEESQKLEAKENELQVTDTEKRQQAPSTPVKDSKKFLTTPRKIITSTPQPGFRNLTPFKKKRDPYEFDSDSSAERFDPEQVLKVFNRQKKEANKKTKTNK